MKTEEKLLRIWLISFVVWGSGCATGPHIKAWVYSADSHQAFAGDEALPEALMSNYVCFSPDDVNSILEWGKRQSDKK